MEERSDPDLLKFFRMKIQVTSQGQAEDADVNRMDKSVIIIFLNSGQAGQGVPVPEDAFDHAANDILNFFALHVLAQTDILHDIPDDGVGFLLNDAG
jgi:hypothetical protein